MTVTDTTGAGYQALLYEMVKPKGAGAPVPHAPAKSGVVAPKTDVAPKHRAKRSSGGATKIQPAGEASARRQPEKEDAVEWLRAGPATPDTDGGGLVTG